MPKIKIEDLNSLKGSNPSIMSSLNEGQQTVDKIKDIVNGINNILTKVQGFKQQQPEQQNKTPTPIPLIKAPEDMQGNKRAIIHIEEDKIIPQIKEFIKDLPEETKAKTLNDFIKQFEGNEQIIKVVAVQLIKQNTKISYID